MNKLNEQQVICVAQYDKIQQAETSVLQVMQDIQQHLMELVRARLAHVEHKAQKLNQQRAKERRQLKLYTDKLNEFSCLMEAQGYMKDHLQPFLMSEQLPLKAKDLNMLEDTMQAILDIDLSYNGLLARSQVKNTENVAIPFVVQDKYPLYILNLKEEDVKSNDIPEIPNKLTIQYEE